MNHFAFELKQTVVVRISGEQGEIRARSEHVDTSNQYLLAYKGADGRSASSWFSEDQLRLTQQGEGPTPSETMTAQSSKTATPDVEEMVNRWATVFLFNPDPVADKPSCACGR